jgi:GT2 family glycosyltransferase
MRLTVVMPTHNRASRLRQNLLALAAQTASADSYEIVVIGDGCTDDTAAIVAAIASSIPCALRFVEQPPRGAAQARNRGAAVATGPILLFLDDDMEASPGLVAAHLAAHRDGGAAVVLGRFWTPPDAAADPLTDSARRWWEERVAARGRREHRFTFLDLLTGNVSMPRDLFDRAGGFDARIGSDMSGEDYELGIRLLAIGARLEYAPDAASVHHDHPIRARALQRAEQEGRGHTRLVQQYPELFWQFGVARLGDSGGWGARALLSTLLWSWPSLGRPFAGCLLWTAAVAAALGRAGLARRLYMTVRGYHYFLGVRSALGSRAAWERLQQDAPLEPAGMREIEIDLGSDLERLDTILAAARPDALRVSHCGTPILRIDPIGGAEPIRGVHVRDALLRRVPGLMLGLLLDEHRTRMAT